MQTIISETKTTLTPELLAKAFWAFDSDEQAQFFLALHGEVSKVESAYGLGEMQWCFMKDSIKALGKEACDMYMALSVFAYDYVTPKHSMED